MSKEKNLKFIKDFSKISVASICEELNVNKSNLWAGKASVKNTENVRKTIEKRVSELIEDERI